MTEQRIQEKIQCFEDWMQGDHVMVHLDARCQGVSVPPEHQQNHSLALQLSYAFRGETLHDEKEVRSYLKFHGEYFECIMPWNAIWGLSSANGDSRVWPQDMPKELLVAMAQTKLRDVGKKVSDKLFGRKQPSGDARPSASPDSSLDTLKGTSKDTSSVDRPPSAKLRDVSLDQNSSNDQKESAREPLVGDNEHSEGATSGTTRRSPSLKRIK